MLVLLLKRGGRHASRMTHTRGAWKAAVAPTAAGTGAAAVAALRRSLDGSPGKAATATAGSSGGVMAVAAREAVRSSLQVGKPCNLNSDECRGSTGHVHR